MERWYRSIPTYQCSTQLPSPPKRLHRHCRNPPTTAGNLSLIPDT